ncbi:isoprenylcysteine carboxylmethyltransferase family protein [Geobacter sp.]|uniref:methyltransferase family protein n=1 Tax=Geobacter sp. TaxID=46610 RepID=UPI0026070230|nr:isoprenylcysteine carboxylmethyltransferase family protein [Geobacter sp.]
MNAATDFTLRFVLFALLHSALATKRLKGALLLRAPKVARFHRIGYNLVAFVTCAWLMSAWPLPPVLYVVPGAGSLIFHALQAGLLISLFRCLVETGVSDFIGTRSLREHQPSGNLVTSGCYGRVRHPLYSLALLLLAFNPVMTLKWLLLTVYSGIYFTIGAVMEERRLEEEFGDVYREYRKRVPMFIPAPHRQTKNKSKPGKV